MKFNKQKYTQKQPIALAVLLLGFLAGCGGGSGGSSDSGAGDGSDPSGPVVAPMISLLAGIPSAIGNQDGSKENAYYGDISGFAIDASGDIVFPDSVNNNIRKISKNGGISTLAGGALTAEQLHIGSQKNSDNYIDAKGSAARFNRPEYPILDAMGNIYVYDGNNRVIRKIDTNSNVTTFAGDGGQCNRDEGLNFERLCDSYGMAVDSLGNIYTVEVNSNLGNPIKKINSAGKVNLLVEKASVNPTEYLHDWGFIAYKYLTVQMAVDKQGVLYVADPNDKVIRKYVNGVLELFSGSERKENSGYVDGVAAQAKFSANMTGIAFDKSNNLYVLDDNKVRKIEADGSVATVLDLSNECSIADGQTQQPEKCYFYNLSIDDDSNFLVQEKISISNTVSYPVNNNLILRQFSMDGKSSVIAGKASVAPLVDADKKKIAQFSRPAALTVTPSGVIYVFDGAIHTISEAGQVSTLDKTAESRCIFNNYAFTEGPAKIQDISSCQFDQIASDVNNNIYASIRAYIVKIKPNGDVGIFSDLNEFAYYGEYSVPVSINGMAISKDGVMYASYTGNGITNIEKSAIFKITEAGEASLFAGSLTTAGHRDGIMTEALFRSPRSLALDSADNLYVLDDIHWSSGAQVGPTVRKITPSGEVTTLAGQYNTSPGLVDGNAHEAVFTFSYRESQYSNANLALDARDNIYIADPKHSVIRKITPAGQVSTFAGTADVHGFLADNLPGVINRPLGVAVHKDALYFSMRNAVGKINLQ